MFTIVLITTCLAIGTSAESPISRPNQKKAVIQEYEKVTFIENTLIIPIKIQTPDNLEQNVFYVRTLIRNTLQELGRYPNKISEARLKTQEATISEYKKLMKTLNHPRERRALLDVGGDLLQAVFGVATNYDLKILREEILNDTRHQKIINEALIVKSALLKKSVDTMNDILREEISTTSNTVNKLQTQITHSARIALITESIQLISSIITNYHATLLSLLSSDISSIITPEKLNNIITENQASPETHLPCDTNNSTCSPSSFIKVEKTANPFLFFARIPFISSHKYQIYEFVPIPIIDHKNKKYIVSNLKRFMGVGHNSYFLSEDLSCANHICPKQPIWLSNKHSTCNKEILENRQQTPSCIIEEINTNPRFHLASLKNSWVVTFFVKNDVSIKCSSTGTVKHFNVVGLFKVKKICDLKSNLVNLSRTTEEIMSKVTVTTYNEDSFNYIPAMNISQYLPNTTENLRLYRYNQFISQLDELKLHLNDTIDQLTSSPTYVFTSNGGHIAVSSTTTSIAIIIMIVAVTIFIRRRAQIRQIRKQIRDSYDTPNLLMSNLKTLEKNGTL